MSSHLWGVRLAVLIAAAASLGACRTFSPDGGMEMVAAVAGTGLHKDVVQIRSAEDAAAVRVRVAKLLHRPLGADAAVQIALLNNLGQQAPVLELCLLRCLDAGRARHRAANHRQPADARDHAGAHKDRLRSIRGGPASRGGGALAGGSREAAR